MIFQPLVGTGTLDDPAQDHHGTQTAIRLIVGGRDLGTSKAGEEEFLLLAQEALAKGLGSRMAQWGATDALELLAQGAPFGFGGFGSPRSLQESAVSAAGVVNPSLQVLAETASGRIGRAAWAAPSQARRSFRPRAHNFTPARTACFCVRAAFWRRAWIWRATSALQRASSNIC
jgi:hypothetical protein